MKLHFRKGALHIQQQAVVKIGRIIDTILVKYQGVGNGADLQQSSPVSIVACQP